MRKLTALFAAAALALTSLAPAAAEARDRDGWRHYDHGYGRHYRHHDDHGDAVAAGAVGLILGLALGSAVASRQQPRPDANCYDNYQRCAPPPQRYYEDERGSAYERDYGSEDDYDASPDRTCRVQEWDARARRNVMVEVPC